MVAIFSTADTMEGSLFENRRRPNRFPRRRPLENLKALCKRQSLPSSQVRSLLGGFRPLWMLLFLRTGYRLLSDRFFNSLSRDAPVTIPNSSSMTRSPLCQGMRIPSRCRAQGRLRPAHPRAPGGISSLPASNELLNRTKVHTEVGLRFGLVSHAWARRW